MFLKQIYCELVGVIKDWISQNAQTVQLWEQSGRKALKFILINQNQFLVAWCTHYTSNV
jgi:hypothetical protein